MLRLPATISKNPVVRPLWILASVALVAALKWGKALLVPITLAVLASLLLSPLVRAGERLVRSRVASVLLVVTAVVLLWGWGAWGVSRQVADLARHLPEYSSRLKKRLDQVRTPIGGVVEKAYQVLRELEQGALSRNTRTDSSPVQVEVVPPVATPLDFLGDALSSMAETIGVAAIILVLVVFLLIHQDDLRDRVVHLMGPSHVNVTTRTLDDAAGAVGRYLLTQTAVNLAYGGLVLLTLLAIGVPNAPLWGLFAGLLRFIPYIGPWIGLACPLLLTLSEFEGWSRPLALTGVVLALDMLFANALEPWLYGRRVGLSPPAVILSACFWAWLWGPVGLLLSVPLTTCVVTLGRHTRSLRFANLLLGDAPPMQPEVRLYQRLLSRNPVHALDFVDAFLKEHSVVELDDELLIPALQLSRQNHAAGDLEDLPYRRVLETTSDLLEAHPDPADAPIAAPDPARPPARLTILSAEPGADDLCATMLSRLVSPGAAQVTLIRGDLLTAEKLDLMRQATPDVLVISALFPSTTLSLRHLLKRLRGQVSGLSVILAVWGDPGAGERTLTLPGCDVQIVSTMGVACRVVGESLARAALVRQVGSPAGPG